MLRIDAAPDFRLLSHVLRDPAQLDRLSFEEFSRAIDAADASRLLGWLVDRIHERRVPASPPAWLADRLLTADSVARGYERALRWEIDRLQRAFLGTGQSWILLKGAAYVAAGLPPGSGRRVADIDVMVPADDLARVEGILNEHGWEIPEMNAYDIRYYREWMHELPPMVHRERRSTVDVHHAILPRTSRLKPSSDRLRQRSVIVGSTRVLCPSHMVLHAAAHLFHDGEIAGAIRDLVDLDQLLRWFGRDHMFWDDLVTEARALDLWRPAFYALRYSRDIFATPIDGGAMKAMTAWAPSAPVLSLMDRLVARSIGADDRATSPAAAFALYVRAHWLRMPPLQVIRHLSRKTLRRS